MHNPDLQFLADRWEGLCEYRLHGTPRPWRELTQWIPDELLDTMIATTPAPLSVGTLALIIEITADVKGWLREAGKPLTGEQGVEEGLGILDGMVGRQPQVPGSWAGDVSLWAECMARKVKLHLGEVPDGQRLKAFCPWCWNDCLVIRCLPSRHGDEPFIRCESGVCAPGESVVSVWWEGLPCWPMSRWEWLNEKLNAHPWNTNQKTNNNKDQQNKGGLHTQLIHN